MKKHTYTTEYSQITPYIFLGTNVCCGIHFNKIKKIGIEADIDLELKRSHDPSKNLHIYLWLPTKDHTAPSKEQLKIGVETLSVLVKAKMKTYVHCKLGHGRSPTLVSAYLIFRYGMTVNKAIEFIRKRRHEIHFFPAQIKALQAFEKKVRKE